MSLAGLLTAISRLALATRSRVWRREALIKGFVLKGDSLFLGRPILSRHADSSVVLGEGIRLFSAVRANPIACAQPCVLRTLASGARLVIGDRVGISGSVVVAASSIQIGDDTLVGSGAMLIDNDFHSRDAAGIWGELNPAHARPIRVGSRVFIGARAIILKGVTVGDDCIVGAGAVVTRPVPDRHVAFGNPAIVRPIPR